MVSHVLLYIVLFVEYYFGSYFLLSDIYIYLLLQGTHLMHSLGPISFIFRAVFDKKLKNNRFLPQIQELTAPRLGNPGSVTDFTHRLLGIYGNKPV